jgi:hypothetical protein
VLSPCLLVSCLGSCVLGVTCLGSVILTYDVYLGIARMIS